MMSSWEEAVCFHFIMVVFFTFQTNTNGEKTLSHHLVAKSVKHFNVILPISDCQIWSKYGPTYYTTLVA